MIIMNRSKEWLLKKADQEDGCFVSVGGFVDDITKIESSPQAFESTRAAFVRLLQLARRAKRLSVEEFAAKAGVELAELVKIESNEHIVPTPRTVYKIAQFLKLPEKKLMALSGLVQLKDSQFSEAAVRFAARSEPVQKLTAQEHKALEEFVMFLNDR
ncbi:MAG: helix-turn-helix transcriptional regulator [Terriglobia bacterium]|jgi:transcriptional regulator with XRE-family HTH domain